MNKQDDEKQPKLELVRGNLLEVRAASAELAAQDLLFQHSILCQACLPYRNPGDDRREWERRNGNTHLKITAGEAMHPTRHELVPIGLPYGPKPRLILSHFNAEALRTGKAEIEVDRTLSGFIERIGLDGNGRDVRTVKDQLARLCASSMRLGAWAEREWGTDTANMHGPIVHRFNLFFPKDERQRVLWPNTIKLSSDYFESLQKHAVPLHPDALAALSHTAMGLDVYAWLAQRLHRIAPERPQLVTWKALRDQFGWHFASSRKFRQVFHVALRQVLTEYPAAKIESSERGLTLHHSAPPVLFRTSPITHGGRRKLDSPPAP